VSSSRVPRPGVEPWAAGVRGECVATLPPAPYLVRYLQLSLSFQGATGEVRCGDHCLFDDSVTEVK